MNQCACNDGGTRAFLEKPRVKPLRRLWMRGTRLAFLWIAATGFAAATPTPSTATPASGVHTYSFQEYLDAVMARSPAILSAQLDAISANYTWYSARASYLPKLVGDARTGLLNGVGIDPFINHTKNHQQGISWGAFDDYGAHLDFPLFKDGTFLGINTPPRAKVKLEEKNIADAKVILTKSEIRYKAVEIYFEALTGHQQTELLSQKVDVLRKEANIVIAKLPYHLVSDDEVKSAQLQLQQAEAMLSQSQFLAVNAFENVATLLGEDDPSRVRIDTRYPVLCVAPNYQGLVTKVLNTHPDLAIQRATLNKAKAEQALAFSAFFPTATVGASYSYGDNYDPPGDEQELAEIDVSVPIFDFGATYFAERAASTTVEAEKKRLLEVKDTLEETMHTDFLGLQSAFTTYSAAQLDLSIKYRAYQKLVVMSGVGQADTLDLLKAQGDYYDSYAAEEGAHYEMLLSNAALEKDSGTAWKCDWKVPSNAISPHVAAPPPAVPPPPMP